VSVAGVIALGLWGVFSPDARAAQGGLNETLRGVGNGPLDFGAQIIDRIFSPLYATLLAGLLAVVVGITRRSVVIGVGFACAVLLVWLPVQIAKVIFHLRRPDASEVLGGLVSVDANSSFPSGHVGFAIALSFALLLLMRAGWAKNLTAGGLVTLVIIVASSRLYTGMHYFSDTVGSVFACAVGILVFSVIWPRIQNRRGFRL
jgi:undecaprenyl-diphosphatase